MTEAGPSNGPVNLVLNISRLTTETINRLTQIKKFAKRTLSSPGSTELQVCENLSYPNDVTSTNGIRRQFIEKTTIFKWGGDLD